MSELLWGHPADSLFDERSVQISANMLQEMLIAAEEAAALEAVPYQPPEKSLYEQRWERFDEQIDFFTRALRQTKEQPYEGRAIHGPLHKGLNAITGDITEALHMFRPRLPHETLILNSYMPFEAEKALLRVPSWQRRRVAALKQEKNGRIAEMVDANLSNLMDQQLPDGLLSVPPYRKQEGDQACVPASFLMIFDAIAGDPDPFYPELEERALLRAATRVHRNYKLHDEEYLKIFQSRAYKEQHGQAMTVSFMGADLDTVGRIAGGIRAKWPDHEVYCMVSLLSNTYKQATLQGIWHSNIVLAADEEAVTVHNPAFYSGEYERLPKDSFFHRWGQAYFRGHLIIAPPAENVPVN